MNTAPIHVAAISPGCVRRRSATIPCAAQVLGGVARFLPCQVRSRSAPKMPEPWTVSMGESESEPERYDALPMARRPDPERKGGRPTAALPVGHGWAGARQDLVAQGLGSLCMWNKAKAAGGSPAHSGCDSFCFPRRLEPRAAGGFSRIMPGNEISGHAGP